MVKKDPAAQEGKGTLCEAGGAGGEDLGRQRPGLVRPTLVVKWRTLPAPTWVILLACTPCCLVSVLPTPAPRALTLLQLPAGGEARGKAFDAVWQVR